MMNALFSKSIFDDAADVDDDSGYENIQAKMITHAFSALIIMFVCDIFFSN